jgi:K+-sensing histidine kinase KdpD
MLLYLKNPKKRKLQREIIRKKEELKIINQKLEIQHKDLNRSYENIRILSEFGQRLTASPDLESIHNMIYDYVSTLMDTSAFGIGIYNVDTNSIEYESFYERGRKLPFFSNSVTEVNSLSAWCHKNAKEIFSNNFTRDFSHYINSLSNLKTREIPQSLIYLPLKFENDILGTITVQSYRKDVYSENDLFVLQLLATYVATAIAGAKTMQVLKYTQEKIVSQNFELLEHRENLERLVNDKTRENEEARKKAEESDRLKSTFLANMSHDIRTPMNSILGFAELLSEEKLTEEQRTQYIDQIRKSSKFLLNILSDIIDISTLEAGQLIKK